MKSLDNSYPLEKFNKLLNKYMGGNLSEEFFVNQLHVIVEDADFRLRQSSIALKFEYDKESFALEQLKKRPKPYTGEMETLQNKYKSGVRLETMLEHFKLTDEQIKQIINV